MNTLIFFLAGISLGLVSDKLYHSYVAGKKHPEGGAKERENVDQKVDKIDTDQTEKGESTQAESISSDTDSGHDDLSQIKGVGPKLEEALNKIGIYNYQQLSSSSVDALFVRLKEAGGKFNKSTIASIVERAQQAV